MVQNEEPSCREGGTPRRPKREAMAGTYSPGVETSRLCTAVRDWISRRADSQCGKRWRFSPNVH